MIVRHCFAALCGAAAVLTAAADPAAAQVKNPQPTVTLVTHSSPGGGTDVFLREMAKALGSVMTGNFVVENVRGGSGAAAIAKVAAATPNGAIFYGTTPTYINVSLLSKPKFTHHDLEPVVNVFTDPQVVFTRAESPHQTLAAVIEAGKGGARQRWGAANPGSLERQVMERMKRLTGINATVVSHDGGGDMLINVLNGSLDIGIGEIQELKGQLDGGKIRLLASFSDRRLVTQPSLPTAREQGVDLAVTKFRGLAGPKGLPAEVIRAWEEAIPKLLEQPGFKKWYTESNLEPAYIPHDRYGPFVAQFAKDEEAFLREQGILKN